MICEEKFVRAASTVRLVELCARPYHSYPLFDGLYFGVSCALRALVPESFVVWQFHRSAIHRVSDYNKA